LIATEVASQEELDRAVEALEVATADVKRTRAATAEAESQLVAAERNLAFQQERLAYTEITSPYDGLVVRRDRDPGGVIIPGGSLLQLVSTNELWVSAWVDETAMAGLKPGQPARVVFRSEPARAFPGEVARLGRETDRETREFVVDVRVSELPAHWAVGQRAEVFIETGCQDSAPCLPIAFLSWRAGKPGVLALQDGRVQWREIQLGLRGRESVEVRGGLPPGAVVCRAREPQRVLKDGQRARATPPPASQP
jgi:RND family efflux transporter MFP subunit